MLHRALRARQGRGGLAHLCFSLLHDVPRRRLQHPCVFCKGGTRWCRESLVMESVALNAPAALGVNLIPITVLCPAATVTGRLGATREKYFVEIAAPLTVTDAGPEFVAVTVRVLLLPTATLPKSAVAVSRERVVDCCWPEEPAALTPWQPTRKVRAARRSNPPATFPRCFGQIAIAAVFSIVSHGTVAPGSTTVCTRGRAHDESGAVGGIAIDVRGTARNRQKASRKNVIRHLHRGLQDRAL